MSTAGMSGTRQANEKAIDKFDSTDVGGGVMPRDLFDDWYQRVQDTATLLGMVRTEVLSRPKMEISRIGVGERMRRGATEGQGAEGDATVSTDGIEIDAEKGTLAWDLTRESVEDTIGNVDEIVLDKMSQQWAIDTQDLAINGDESSGDAFVNQNDGWLQILEDDSETHTYDHQGGGMDVSLFHESRAALPNKYKRTEVFEPVYMMNLSDIEDFEYELTQREDPLGAAVIFSDEDLTPFNYDIFGFAGWPEGEALLTHPQNLIYALWRNTEVEVLTETDKTAEEDLFARYFMRTRDDFAVQDADAAVKIENIT